MKQRTCKKCGANLPKGYEPDLCQHCMGKKGYKIRNIGIAVVGGLVTVGGIALTVVRKAIGK